MGLSIFLSETRKIESSFEELPADIICSCNGGYTLTFDPNTRQYVPQGGCDPSGICACISIEKHKARTSTRHFLKLEQSRNQKAKRKNSGPLDRYFALEP